MEIRRPHRIFSRRSDPHYYLKMRRQQEVSESVLRSSRYN